MAGKGQVCRDCQHREQSERQRKPWGYDRIYVFSKQGYRVWGWDMPDGRRVNHNEHRIVMERELGRELLPEENVHHRNGDRADNRPENLELWNTSQPAGQRAEDKVAHALHILGLYAPELLALASAHD